MVAPVVRCATHSGELEEGAKEIVVIMKIGTQTPQEFDDACAKYPGYKLTHGAQMGWNALGLAAYHGNIPLIQHILGKPNAKETLLELGNRVGWTPLFCAVRNNQEEAAKTLIGMGANVNMASLRYASSSDIPEGATPLWVAVKRIHKIALVKLLLYKGALLAPALDVFDKDAQIVEQAWKEMSQEYTQLMKSCTSRRCLFY
jgi:hypothetical protein